MPVTRLSISLTRELNAALRQTARQMRMELSRLVETLLRENPVVRREVNRLRAVPEPSTKRGRPIEKLVLVGKASRALWEQRLASGQVKVLGR